MSSFDLWHVDAQNSVIERGTVIVNVALKACSNGGCECCEDEKRHHFERGFESELVPIKRVYKCIKELWLEYLYFLSVGACWGSLHVGR